MWHEKKNYGRTYMGIVRSAFLVDERGQGRRGVVQDQPGRHARRSCWRRCRCERRAARPRPTSCRTGRRSCSSTSWLDSSRAVGPPGTWSLRGDEWFFAGHFPGRPTLPGVLMCEAIAQVGAIAVLTDERFAGKLPLFGGLDGARFRRQVVPGDTLWLEVELGRMSAAGRQGHRAGPRRWRAATSRASCELLFVVVDA